MSSLNNLRASIVDKDCTDSYNPWNSSLFSFASTNFSFNWSERLLNALHIVQKYKKKIIKERIISG
jgi:hypothetical protein